MNVKKIFFDAPAEFFVKLLDEKERDVGFNGIISVALAQHYLTTGLDLKSCKEDLGLRLDVPDDAIENGLSILSHSRESVYFGIDRKTFLDFYFHFKSEQEYVSLLAFLALKTIIGRNRTYAKFSNDYWLSRMNGYHLTQRDLHPVIRKYSTRKLFRKIKESLTESYNVNFATKKMRGYLASVKLSSEELDAMLDEKRQDNVKKVDKTKKQTEDKAESTTKKSKEAVKIDNPPLWRTDFNEYKRLFEEAKKIVLSDIEFRTKQEYYYTNIDFEKSIEKSCDYWLSEDGWKKCKSYKSREINPVKRLMDNFGKNKVYKSFTRSNSPQAYVRKDGQFDNIDANEWNKNRR